MDNIVIDYLKSNSCNYAYTVFMREKNIIPEDIMAKSQIAVILNVLH
jgi:hypothetical protein